MNARDNPRAPHNQPFRKPGSEKPKEDPKS